MSFQNTSGLPKTQLYTLGRGKAFIAELDQDTDLPAGGFRDLGNLPEFSINVTEETLDHFTTMFGTKVKDATVSISQALDASFQLDEISFQNLMLFLNASLGTVTNPAKTTTYTDEEITDNVELGRWYELVDTTSGVRVFGITSTMGLSLEVGVTALTEGVDYKVDNDLGMVFFYEDAVDVAPGDTVTFTTSAVDAAAKDGDILQLMMQSEKTYAFRFQAVATQFSGDKKLEFYFRKIRLKSNGDHQLIADEWKMVPFTFSAEASSNSAHAANPYGYAFALSA